MIDPNIPTATWVVIAPNVRVWHNHGYAVPLSRIGASGHPGTVRIELLP